MVEPVPLGDGVVVEEGHELAAGCGDSGVAAGGEAAGARVGEHPHLLVEPLFRVLLGEPGEEPLVVVDHEQCLQRRQ